MKLGNWKGKDPNQIMHFYFSIWLRILLLVTKYALKKNHYHGYDKLVNDTIFWLFQDTLEALKALSTFFNENNLRTRRNLRGDIEKRSLNINEEYVGAFKQVKEKLDDLYSDVEAMNNCCNDMTGRLRVSPFLLTLIHSANKFTFQFWLRSLTLFELSMRKPSWWTALAERRHAARTEWMTSWRRHWMQLAYLLFSN